MNRILGCLAIAAGLFLAQPVLACASGSDCRSEGSSKSKNALESKLQQIACDTRPCLVPEPKSGEGMRAACGSSDGCRMDSAKGKILEESLDEIIVIACTTSDC